MHLLLPLLLALPAHAQGSAALPVVVDQLVTAVTDGEYEAAAERAQATIDGMAAWTTPPDPHQLATLWQVLGAVGVYGQQDALIAPSLTQACAIDSQNFEERLGPKVQSQWEAACRHVEPNARLEVGPLRDDSALWIDGCQQQPGPVTLAPGQHLVQVLTPEQELFVAVVTLDTDQQATLDTGIVLPPKPREGGAHRAVLAAGTGSALVAGAALGVLAWQAHGTYASAHQACTDSPTGCSAETGALIQQTWQQRNHNAIGAGVAGGLAIGLGATLVITW